MIKEGDDLDVLLKLTHLNDVVDLPKTQLFGSSENDQKPIIQNIWKLINTLLN